MPTRIVSYELDPQTLVQFEIEPTSDFHPVGTEEILGRVRDAVRPAIESAKTVLNQVAAMGPDETQIKFGVKASGSANWVVAKAATEANFEITLTWRKKNPAGES